MKSIIHTVNLWRQILPIAAPRTGQTHRVLYASSLGDLDHSQFALRSTHSPKRYLGFDLLGYKGVRQGLLTNIY